MQSCGLQPETRASRKGKARGVKEVETVAALGHMDDILAVEGVVGDHIIDGLLHPQTFGIVDETSGGVRIAHLLKLAAILPGESPGIGAPYVSRFCACLNRIANGVVFNGCSVVVNQLVFPDVIISIGHSFQDGSQCFRGVVIPFLVQNITAAVIFIRPSGAVRAAGGVVFIVHTNQLAQGIVIMNGKTVFRIYIERLQMKAGSPD